MNGQKDRDEETPEPLPRRSPEPDSDPESDPEFYPDEDVPEPGRGDVLPAQVDPDKDWDRG
ncbi:MAG TPA: hypothetical protein VES88_12380 [Gemmatimonadaceae bacterium]|nr:hypothetical protein [Gemmatimonadaceae bacterium]